MDIIIKGIYRHFKGDLYIVEDIAINSETLEEIVVYRALYGDNKLWVRPLSMFFDEVNKNKYTSEKKAINSLTKYWDNSEIKPFFRENSK